ncbi:unnamed protein product, partial [Rotaria socialis]
MSSDPISSSQIDNNSSNNDNQ